MSTNQINFTGVAAGASVKGNVTITHKSYEEGKVFLPPNASKEDRDNVQKLKEFMKTLYQPNVTTKNPNHNIVYVQAGAKIGGNVYINNKEEQNSSDFIQK